MQSRMTRCHLMQKLAIVCVSMLCVMAFVLTGCNEAPEASQPESPETIEFVDSCGRTVELPANIERIAVTGPLAQQIILPIASDKMVGVARSLSDSQLKYFGNELADLPEFGQIYGGKGDYNKEAVAAAEPQVIIDAGDAKKSIVEDMDEVQEATGIPTIHIQAVPGHFDETYITLGKILGEEQRGTELAEYAAQSHEKVTKIMSNIDDADRVKIAYIAGEDGTMVKAKTSFNAQIFDEICDNVAVLPEGEKLSGKGNEVGFEQIANWNPEMIVFAPGSIYKDVANEAEWQTLDAIANNNFYEVPNKPYNWIADPVSVSSILGEQWLVELCYPEKSDIDINEAVKSYYKIFYNYDLTSSELDELLSTAIPA